MWMLLFGFIADFIFIFFCTLGASTREAENWQSGGHDERAAGSYGEGAGRHASQSTGQLPGVAEHANKGKNQDS